MLDATRLTLSLAAVGLAFCTAFPARALAAPPSAPPPPPNTKKFPKATSKPPVARIIRLAPNQTTITREQLKNAPTVDEANQRRSVRTGKPSSNVPGTPPILRVPKRPAARATPPKPTPASGSRPKLIVPPAKKKK